MVEGSEYYIEHRSELFDRFHLHAEEWRSLLTDSHDKPTAEEIINDAREHFEKLIPRLPYSGGDDHPWTGVVIRAGICLALFRAMEARGYTAEETGKLLYDAAERREPKPMNISPEKLLTEDQMMQWRSKRAEESQKRECPDAYVFRIVKGDGKRFDYGYDFTKCTTHDFFIAEGAPELSPYFCFLDFPRSRKSHIGMMRTQELSTGAPYCNHRFRRGYVSDQTWPPPFLHRS